MLVEILICSIPFVSTLNAALQPGTNAGFHSDTKIGCMILASLSTTTSLHLQSLGAACKQMNIIITSLAKKFHAVNLVESWIVLLDFTGCIRLTLVIRYFLFLLFQHRYVRFMSTYVNSMWKKAIILSFRRRKRDFVEEIFLIHLGGRYFTGMAPALLYLGLATLLNSIVSLMPMSIATKLLVLCFWCKIGVQTKNRLGCSLHFLTFLTFLSLDKLSGFEQDQVKI